jgi:hypothetical protein
MLLQSNSYIVPKDKRDEHTRLVQRFRQTLARLGCDHFECYEQVGARWSVDAGTGRFIQVMRFRDIKQQQAVEAAERTDPTAQALIREFCELINLPYQQQQGLFAVGFYRSVLPPTLRTRPATAGGEEPASVAANTPVAAPPPPPPRRGGFIPPAPPAPPVPVVVKPQSPPAPSQPVADRPAPTDPASDVGDSWIGGPPANGEPAGEAGDDVMGGRPAQPAPQWAVTSDEQQQLSEDDLLADDGGNRTR